MIQRGTFTFQSGTIQAIPGRDGSLISLDFTFQSGTIQARRSGKGVCCHSFTFQSGTIQANLSQGFHREPFSFTFQSGTIQAILCAFLNVPETFFTFQSGTIQARRTAESCFQCFQLQFLSTMII